jgi:hypothetical protein
MRSRSVAEVVRVITIITVSIGFKSGIDQNLYSQQMVDVSSATTQAIVVLLGWFLVLLACTVMRKILHCFRR